MKKWLVYALCAALLLGAMPCAGAETLTLSFIGDCSIGEAIQFKGDEEGYTWVLDNKGMDWPFSLVRAYLDNDDFTFANLEVVFTSRTKHADKKWPLVGEPRYAQALLHSGIDVVNTVNNHCFDYMQDGYTDSIATLNALPMRHFGSVYIGHKSAQDVLLEAEVKGVKIGAMGFTYPQDSDLKYIRERVGILRERGCDLIVVSLHWGRETQPMPESWQFKFARNCIDAGADIIWGHHPHVLQPVQFYKGGAILYSTGNFTFGTMSSLVDRDTGIFQLTYDVDDETGAVSLSRFSLIPCTTTGKGDYRPYVFEEEADRARVFKKLLYTRDVANMINLPQSFVETGEALFENGEIVR